MGYSRPRFGLLMVSKTKMKTSGLLTNLRTKPAK